MAKRFQCPDKLYVDGNGVCETECLHRRYQKLEVYINRQYPDRNFGSLRGIVSGPGQTMVGIASPL